jgi:hypothetical protein
LAEVHIQDGETLENALRRFKRKVLQEDIISIAASRTTAASEECPVNAAYAAIAKALAHLPDETVVDGEIVAIVLVGQVEYGSFYRCLQQNEMTIIPPTKPTKRAA